MAARGYGLIILREYLVEGYNTDEFVNGTAADGNIDVMKRNESLHDTTFVVFQINPVYLRAVRHNITGIHIGKTKHALHQLRFFLAEGTQFGALLQRSRISSAVTG